MEQRAGSDAEKRIVLLSSRSLGGEAPQLGEAVADAVVNALAQGILVPGQRIVEADLAAQLKLSRVPIREAIKILHAQGIVQVVPNRGARVVAFDRTFVEQIFEVRVALEKVALKHARENYVADPRRLDALREIVSRMERAAHWLDWVEFRRCDVDFHREICRASGNVIVLKLWEAIARHITIIFGLELAAERDFELVIEQHRELIERLAADDPTLERILEQHITRLRTLAAKYP